ncbi:MAG: helix-turn-helix transcriptional regulator [Candidatus Hodarchaeota archaeon]
MGNNHPIRLLFITLLFFTPILPSKASDTIQKELEMQNTPIQTGFNITNANLYFEIHSKGKYSCSFSLQVVVNEQTSPNDLGGLFKIEDVNISNFILILSMVPINCSVYTEGNFSLCNFTVDQELLPGFEYEFLGSFQGMYCENNSGIYTFHLGIEWGTLVGNQETKIHFDDREYNLVLPIEPKGFQISHPAAYITEVKWLKSFWTGFTAKVNVFQKSTPNFFLNADISFWNSSVGESIDVTLNNTGTFPLNVWIITPNWITSNVTTFMILTDQKAVIRLRISSKAKLGMNETIQIGTLEFDQIIKIPVHVVNEESPNSSPNELFIILAFFSILIGTGAIGLTLYQRNTINRIILRIKKQGIISDRSVELASSLSPETSLITPNGTLTENLELSWEFIQSRWQNKLTENELQVIQILFKQGSMNQQTIADQMNVSKVKMSRIISRLETKGLLFRERFGMSNIIKLHKERL